MQLLLTSDDFAKLSTVCQQELMQLFTRGNDLWATNSAPANFVELDTGISHKNKSVVTISAEQATHLIANISKKSLDVLKQFAEERTIALDRLIGEGSPYRDQTDFKRSFIGAVTRRLRTVTGDRKATLFARSQRSEGIESKIYISIRAESAQSLRRATGTYSPEYSAFELSSGNEMNILEAENLEPDGIPWETH